MLIGLLFVYLLSLVGGSSDILLGEWLIKKSKSEFKEVIPDKDRSKEAMKVLDGMIKEARKFNSGADKAGKKLEKLVSDYNSTPEDFNQLFSELQANREASSAKILDLFPELKKNITREEWTKAFPEANNKQSQDK